MILVDATIQGSPRTFQFILDSGAGETVLAKHAATELGLTLTASERIRTVHGTENAGRAASTTIRLGTSPNSPGFSPSPLVVDLASESRTLGTAIDGLLGADFFHGRSIKIDFKQSRLHLSPAGKPGSQATRLPLSRSRGAMFVELTAADSRLQRVRLDTGCCRSLCWSPPGGSALRSLWHDGKTINIDVNFGPLVMADIPSDVYHRPLFAGEDGLLGTALLSRFDSVWIDAVNNRITFDTVRD
ncbi:MAG: hypothetical protein RLZZ214_2643, partial [Verrucomicrobiota bacterium]|jgi:hypothetical protein